jgi:hypothetical protein
MRLFGSDCYLKAGWCRIHDLLLYPGALLLGLRLSSAVVVLEIFKFRRWVAAKERALAHQVPAWRRYTSEAES